MKKIILIILILAAGAGIYWKMNQKLKTGDNPEAINNLINHFKSAQLSAADTYIPENEKAFAQNVGKGVDEFKKKYGIKTDYNKAPLESRHLTINSIDVVIYRYKTNEGAKLAYDNGIKGEERDYKESVEKNTPLFKTDYFVNKNLLMKISHFKVTMDGGIDSPMKGGLKPNKIDLNESDLNKIKEAFNTFKP